jgi:hypothetical protein
MRFSTSIFFTNQFIAGVSDIGDETLETLVEKKSAYLHLKVNLKYKLII